jgi:hypothetical protein
MRKLTLGWYLYGEGKLVIGLVTVEGHQPSWRTVRQRDDQKLPVGTVVVAGQGDFLRLDGGNCWFDILIEP